MPVFSVAIFIGVLLTGVLISSRECAAANLRIGELNSYAAFPSFAEPYRNGWKLAVDEINRNGGIEGRLLEVVSLDDGASRQSAARRAQELVVNHEVEILAGTFLSNAGLAVANIAAKSRKVFIAAGPQSDALTWDHGNRYTFRFRPSTYMQAAMLVEQAAALPARRWATIAPNYEYGQSAVASFRALLKARRPDVEFVGEQWPALGKLDAGDVLRNIQRSKPDAVFNATFGADLSRLLDEGGRTGFFAHVPLMSMSSADADVMQAVARNAPAGWLVAGVPATPPELPAYRHFSDSYAARYKVEPPLSALVGYTMIQAIAQGVRQAKSTDADKLIAALRGLRFDTPIGAVRFRAIDHQSTMGAFLTPLPGSGRTPMQWRYLDGAKYLPDDDFVRLRRPASAMR